MAKVPQVNAEGHKELDKVERQFDEFKEQVETLTMDRMNLSPKIDMEPIHKIANKDLDKDNVIYLKPHTQISCAPTEKFNEKFRKAYEYDNERVEFTAEHRELIGETIEMWMKPYAGMSAGYWKIPTGKKVNAPRYIFEKLQRTGYHRLRMDETRQTNSDGTGTFYGQMIVDNYVPRLDAFITPAKRNVYMGARNY